MSIWSILFSYKGRISRKTYWCAVAMWNLVFWICIAVVFFSFESRSFIVTVPFALLLLLLFYVGYPMRVKRWHDRDKSGWWVLIGLIPVIGGLWMIIECGFLKGTEGSNRFGPDPLLNDLNPDLIKYVTVSTGTADNPWLATAHLVGSTGNREPRIIYGGEDESEARRQALLFSERFQCEIIQ
jgi:uncharacterized membrane protein YhaH (DUF805 family)